MIDPRTEALLTFARNQSAAGATLRAIAIDLRDMHQTAYSNQVDHAFY